MERGTGQGRPALAWFGSAAAGILRGRHGACTRTSRALWRTSKPAQAGRGWLPLPAGSAGPCPHWQPAAAARAATAACCACCRHHERCCRWHCCCCRHRWWWRCCCLAPLPPPVHLAGRAASSAPPAWWAGPGPPACAGRTQWHGRQPPPPPLPARRGPHPPQAMRWEPLRGGRRVGR